MSSSSDGLMQEQYIASKLSIRTVMLAVRHLVAMLISVFALPCFAHV